tara:strand:- start:61 stop:534 length:474 start_codon:yes stop_codon:yes gene_type:complete
MMQNKLLNFWHSLQAREKRILKFTSIIFPITLLFCYLLHMSEAIDSKKRNLLVAESTFNYVYDKANNFQKFSLVQEAISKFPASNNFIFSESQRFKLTDFQLGEEQGFPFISFKDKSATNYSQFLESLTRHPAITIQHLKITPTENFYLIVVRLELM